jgi:microcystin-dependent protein
MTMASPSAHAGAEPWIGEIAMVGYSFCPRGWIDANGQLLQIAQYQALFSLYGTMYGGDGRTTFGLPDLRGRMAMNVGNGPGLSPRQMGQKGGQETVTIMTSQMPAHTHTGSLVPTTAAPSEPNPEGNSFATFPRRAANIYSPSAPDATPMHAGTIVNANTGDGQAEGNSRNVQVKHRVNTAKTG